MKAGEAIDKNPGQPVVVLVDNAAAKENVSRLAKSRGYKATVEILDDGFRLVLSPLAGESQSEG
jgi:TusA-related sulfurtransferase